MPGRVVFLIVVTVTTVFVPSFTDMAFPPVIMAIIMTVNDWNGGIEVPVYIAARLLSRRDRWSYQRSQRESQ